MGQSSPLHIEDLHPFYDYQLRMAAQTVDIGPYSDIVSWRMPEDGKYFLKVYNVFKLVIRLHIPQVKMLYERHTYVYNIFLIHAAPSTAPLYISTADVMSTQLTLLWLPPENSERNGVVRSYLILLTSINTEISSSYNTSGNSTSLLIESLHPTYSYVIMVAAVTILQGPYSDLIHVTMEEDSKPDNDYIHIEVHYYL